MPCTKFIPASKPARVPTPPETQELTTSHTPTPLAPWSRDRQCSSGRKAPMMGNSAAVVASVEIARCLVNYGSSDVQRIRGLHSRDLAGALGYLGAETRADRDNICVLTAAAHEEGAGGGPR